MVSVLQHLPQQVVQFRRNSSCICQALLHQLPSYLPLFQGYFVHMAVLITACFTFMGDLSDGFSVQVHPLITSLPVCYISP